MQQHSKTRQTHTHIKKKAGKKEKKQTREKKRKGTIYTPAGEQEG